MSNMVAVVEDLTDVVRMGAIENVTDLTVGSVLTDVYRDNGLGRMNVNDQGYPYWDELGGVAVSRDMRAEVGSAPPYEVKTLTPANLAQYEKLRLSFEEWRSKTRLVPSPWRDTLIAENEESVRWRLEMIAKDVDAGRWSTVADYYAYERVPGKLAAAWANLEDILQAIGVVPAGTPEPEKAAIAQKVVEASTEKAESATPWKTLALIFGAVAAAGVAGAAIYALSPGRR